MFGKIKDRLRSVFSKSEELIEDVVEEDIQEEVPEVKEEKPKKEKKKKVEKKESKKSENKEKEKKEEELKEKEEKEEETVFEKEESLEDKTKVEEESKITEEKASEEENKELEDREGILEEKEEKKGFFSRVFSKKEKKEEVEEDSQEIQEEVEGLETSEEDSDEESEEKEEKKEEEKGFFKRTFSKLSSKTLDSDDFEKLWLELEVFLLEINIAYEIVQTIEERLKKVVIDHSFDRFSLSEAIRKVMTEEVQKVLVERESNFLERIKEELTVEKPLPLLVLGVNGTGKTTTLAKLVHFFKKNNISCVLAAADTFRAAAREQLEEHAKRLDVKIIQHKSGSDPAAVAFDALEHAKARGIDVVLIDTAGRMPNNANLMMELQKVARVSKSRMSVFIGDSISGNDLIEQIDLFSQGVPVDGVILTKVDTDEKPGSVVTAAYTIEKPIFFLGVGQKYDDLIEFNAKHIANELFKLD